MVNSVTLIGNVGNVKPLKETKFGSSFLGFSVCTERRKKGNDGSYTKETTWHNVAVFGARSEYLASVLEAGTKVYVLGRIEYQKYIGKDGTEKISTSIIAEDIHVLSKSGNSTTAGTTEPQRARRQPVAPAPAPKTPARKPQPAYEEDDAGAYSNDDEDDLPF